jgi:hypothetical protein
MNSYFTFPKARNHLKAKNILTDSPNHSCVIDLHHGVVLCRLLVEIGYYNIIKLMIILGELTYYLTLT